MPRKKRRALPDGASMRVQMQFMDGGSFRRTFSDGSPDLTSPHRKGFRFADTNDADRLAARDAYAEMVKRKTDAWRTRGQQQDADESERTPRGVRAPTLDEARAAADAAYRECCERKRNAWRTAKEA